MCTIGFSLAPMKAARVSVWSPTRSESQGPLSLGEQRSCEADQHARCPWCAALRARRIGGAIEPTLEHVVGIQLPQAKVVTSRLQDRLEQRQADELGRVHRSAELGRSR